MPRPLLVYAICPRPRKRIVLAGMAGEPLALVACGDLAALTGLLPRAPRTSVAALRRYDAVLRTIAGCLPAVLPARFGTCMESAEELAFVLRARAASLRPALREVRGRVQMTLRGVDAPRQASLVDLVAGQGVSGRDYLQALARVAARERETPALQPVVAAVARWVRAERVEHSGELASVYHLIPRASVPAYVGAARRAAQEEGVRMVLSGPFPAYAFAGW